VIFLNSKIERKSWRDREGGGLSIGKRNKSKRKILIMELYYLGLVT
jgi:hypothetical protein